MFKFFNNSIMPVKKILLLVPLLIAIACADCRAQENAIGEIAILDMLFMSPYNYNFAEDVFRDAGVKSVSISYDSLKINIEVGKDGLKQKTVIEGLGDFTYNYYDDRRVSDIVIHVEKFGDLEARVIFSYGSPKADYDAFFLYKRQGGEGQNITYFCDGEGRVKRLSLSVQRLQSMECRFFYEDNRISKISFSELGPDYYDKVSVTSVYTYGNNGLIDSQSSVLSGGVLMKAAYSYTFYGNEN